jgi:hypothetical protein
MSARWLRRALPVLITAVVVAPAAAFAATTYTDVPASSPYSAAVRYLDAARIVTGCKADKFCPNDNAKRGDVATWLFHMSGNDPLVAPSVNASTVGGLTPDQLKGQTGPQGPAGVSGYETLATFKSGGDDPATGFSVTALCPSGKVAIGGGGGKVGHFFMTASFASGNTGWEVHFETPTETPEKWGGFAYVVCATVSG